MHDQLLARTGVTGASARFAAVWPRSGRTDGFAWFEGGRAEGRRFEVCLEAVDELCAWLAADERTQVALVTLSGIGFPWAGHPAAQDFVFSARPPALGDWVRFRTENGFPEVRWFEMFQPIALALGERATVFWLTEQVIEALPAPEEGRRDSPWLAGLLRAGGLRGLSPAPLLHRLCDWARDGDPWAIEECVAFLELDSRGYWHNRARAKMARRLKHVPLREEQRRRVVAAVLRKLEQGDFTEQFRDQLKLVLLLDPEAAEASAEQAIGSNRDHVRRLASFVLDQVRAKAG